VVFFLDSQGSFYILLPEKVSSLSAETVQYVSNIYKYYIAYRWITDKLVLKAEVKKRKVSP